MQRDLHTVDAIFKDAHASTIEYPAENIWEKISIELDKEASRTDTPWRFDWRRIALIIILINARLLLHDSAIPNTGLGSKNLISKRVQLDTSERKTVEEEIYNSHSKSVKSAFDSKGNRQSSLVSKDNSTHSIINNKKSSSLSEIEIPNADLSVFQVVETFPHPESRHRNSQVARSRRLFELKIPDSISTSISWTPEPLPQPTQSSQKWWLNPFFSADMARYRLDSEVGPTSQEEKVRILDREQHEFSFSTGVLFETEIFRKVRLKAGISYSKIGISIAPQQLYASLEENKVMFKYVASSGYGYFNPPAGNATNLGDSIMCAEAKQSVEAISLPLLVGYKFKTRKIDIIPSAGLFFNIITKANLKTEFTQASDKEEIYIEKLHGAKDAYLGFIADVTFSYPLSRRLSFYCSPNVKYAMTSITSKNVVKTFPYSLGLSGGITLGL